MSLDDLPDPPPAPEAPRRVRLHPYQWLGVAVLAALPALALAGVFGETWHVEQVSAGAMTARVSYPARFRYKQLNQIEIQLQNRSGPPPDTVRIALDTAFATRFSTVRAIPPFDRPFELALSDVGPGKGRLALIEIQAERYGVHTGTLVITTTGPDTLRIPLRILVFP